jgi:hypothetical protein
MTMIRSFALLTGAPGKIAAFGALVAAIGALASAEGCGPGDTRYYCDATGCYNCDGYGCHQVTPPAPTQCTGQSSCAQNQICTSQGCVNVCQADTDCPQGDVCKSGQCVAPTAPPGNLVTCTKDSDCPTGEQCVGSGAWAQCTAPSNVCKYSSECAQGEVCANGECLADCSQGQTCATGTTCQKGVCVPDAGSQCTSDAQCSGSTPKCENGSCVAACDPNATPDTCGAGFYCDNGACVVDTRPQPNCGSAAQCLSNQVCLDGFCRYSCSTDTDCKLIDARIGYCAADKTCRDAQEAQAQCTDASQCQSGQLCISNTCQ